MQSSITIFWLILLPGKYIKFYEGIPTYPLKAVLLYLGLIVSDKAE